MEADMNNFPLFFLLILGLPAAGQLQGSTEIRVQLPPKHTAYHLSTQRCLSALGIRWRNDNHMIMYVDENSDVHGKVYPGDVVISEDGMSPDVFHNGRYFLNDQNTPVQLVISRQGVIYSFTALRHPLTFFGPGWSQGGRYY
jgi:hypothetical protein